MPRETSNVRARLWVERGGEKALTDAGADLLEQIDACGSLSEAARKLRFAYRRAWMLLDVMNHAWPSPLVTTSIGGKRGGGATLTHTGRHVLKTFRSVQLQVDHLIDLLDDPFEPMP